MKSHPDKLRRRSIRLKGYDYTQSGAYFVTICAQNREGLFGEVVNGEMVLSEAGKMVGHIWKELLIRFPSVELDAFVVMPNHIHGIIIIVGAGLALPYSPKLGDVVGTFKSISAICVNRLLSRVGQPLWQRNYYEHIIRDEDKLNLIRQYILENPLRWEMDRENPAAKTKMIKKGELWQV